MDFDFTENFRNGEVGIHTFSGSSTQQKQNTMYPFWLKLDAEAN